MSPGTGCMKPIRKVLPEDLEITSVTTLGSIPKPSAMRNASLTATPHTPAIRLLQSLTTSPLPTGPTWITLAPIAESAGRASSKSPAAPPTMIASVPSVARGVPPETGAPMKRPPRGGGWASGGVPWGAERAAAPSPAGAGDRGVVLLAHAAGHGQPIDLGGGAGHRRRPPRLLRETPVAVEILHHEPDREAGVEAAGQDEARELVVARVGASARGLDDLDRPRRIHPRPRRHRHRLARQREHAAPAHAHHAP